MLRLRPRSISWTWILLAFNVLIAAPAHGTNNPIGDLCYAVADGFNYGGQCADNGNANDTLATINRTNGSVASVNGSIPNMSTKNVEAIAFAPGTQTLYAANANQLGTVNLTTAAFSAKANTFGSASGYVGTSHSKVTIAIDDVDGITFDPATGILWGANRRDGATADTLVQIDPATGKIVKNAFPDPYVGGGTVDFREVAPIGSLADVDDISIDPTDSTLYGVINSSGSDGKLVKINKQTGATTEVGDLKINGTNTIVNDVEGLSFFNDGLLYGSTGDTGGQKNALYKIDKTTAKATLVGSFGNDLNDIEGIACLTQQKFTISGTTVFQGTNAPISGVTVTATGLTSQSTNVSGAYTFADVVNGSYTLSASKTGYVVVSQNFTNPVVVNGVNQPNKNFVLACAAGYTFNNGECRPAYSISGKATFQGTGTAISGVTITGSGLSNQSTNGSGQYSFANVVNGSYTLGASKTGYVVVSQSFTNPVAVSGANQVNKDFVLACAAGYSFIGGDCVPVFTISGQATYQGNGSAVSGVTITGTGLTNQSTNGSGQYSFTGVPNGGYTLGASKAGYVVVSQSFTNPVSVNGANQVNKDFVLACANGYSFIGGACVPVFSISGGVTYQGDGSAVAGVTITGTGLSNQSTNASGQYSFTGVTNGSYTLAASKPGYVVVSQNFTNPVGVSGANQTNKNFVLGCAAGYSFIAGQCQAIFSISGSATLQGSNTPISGVTIAGSGIGSQSTNGSGAYSFAGVVNGNYTLTASKTGYVVVSQNFTNPVGVSGANQTNKNFVLGCAAGYAEVSGQCVAVFAVRGHAFLEGTNAPLSGVSIGGIAGGQTTAADGSFVFTGVANGSFTLSAASSGYVVKSQNFANPVVVANADQNNKDFVLGCASGMTFSNGGCEQIQSIHDDASDGTYIDYVLVTFTTTQNAKSYDIYRSDTAGPLGTKIGSVNAGSTTYQDTSAVPDQHYFYTVISDNGVQSNQDEGWRPAQEVCPQGQDCINEQMAPSACSSANGFLGQVNIASVINRYSTSLDFTIEYRDLAGISRGQVTTSIQPFQKMDFIVNDLGLAKDTYGTVCVTAHTTATGAWSGGLTLYKANSRDGDTTFGSDFDFALYYPFSNPRTGKYTLPLNTYHLGVRMDGTVANWVRITDAVAKDGQGLRGTLHYYNQAGEQVHADPVSLPDGGRFDFSGHEALGGADNHDAVGMVRFEPETNADGTAAKFYMTLGRYFYDCVGASCNNFYTALAIPHRPGASVGTVGGISTVNGEISVIELNNVGDVPTTAEISAFNDAGLPSGQNSVNVPPLGTNHTIVNKSAELGFFATETVGMADISPTSGSASASTFFYKLNDKGVLQYAYAAPFSASPDAVQVSEFNSFIGNKNAVEVYNSTGESIKAQLTARNAQNQVVLDIPLTVPAQGTLRRDLTLPVDTYGTITLQAPKKGLVLRNYVSRPGEYVLPFNAQ